MIASSRRSGRDRSRRARVGRRGAAPGPPRGRRAASSTQCQADWAMTTSTEDGSAGISSAWPARTSTRGSAAARTARMRSSGSTAVTWSTRSASSRVRMPVPAPISRTSVASVGKEPVECLGRRAGAEPVVLVRDLSEGPAQDGGVLVLAHARQSSEMAGSVNRRRGPVGRGASQSPGRGGSDPSLGEVGRRDKVVTHAEVAQW